MSEESDRELMSLILAELGSKSAIVLQCSFLELLELQTLLQTAAKKIEILIRKEI